jgi:hypothetical protein
MKKNTTLASLYSLPGYRARSKLQGMMSDPGARVITLVRRQKKHIVLPVAKARAVFMTVAFTKSGTWMPPGFGSTFSLSTAGYSAAGAWR